MNKGKAATRLAVVAASLVQPEKNPYEVHEIPAAEDADVGVDWNALPTSIVTWVRVPGTTVDYPVVQGQAESSDFYLTARCRRHALRIGALSTSTPTAHRAPRARSSSSAGTTCPTVPCSRRQLSTRRTTSPRGTAPSGSSPAKRRSNSRSSRRAWLTRAQRANAPTSPIRRSLTPISGTNYPDARSSWKSRQMSPKSGSSSPAATRRATPAPWSTRRR